MSENDSQRPQDVGNAGETQQQPRVQVEEHLRLAEHVIRVPPFLQRLGTARRGVGGGQPAPPAPARRARRQQVRTRA